MRANLFAVIGILVLVMMPAGVAQQGHPLVGVWSGDWGTTAGQRHNVVMELIWTNTTLSGNINPGEDDAAQIKTGALNSSNWTVHIEAEGKDAKGAIVKTVIDGQIENLGSPKRTLSGTWVSGTTKGTFKLARE